MATDAAAGRLFIEEGTVVPRRLAQDRVVAGAVGDPLPVAKSDLLYLWDEHGREYLDFAAVMHPLGHRFRPVMEMVSQHMRYYGQTAPPGQHLLRWPVALAEWLSAAFTGPGEEPRRVLLCEGERHAVSEAVRLVSAGKPVGVLDTGWHDWLPGDTRMVTPTAFLTVDWGNLGALLLSTVTTALHPILGIREVMLLARTAGVPVIVDESVTGFGRTGVMWSQEHTGMVADVTVVGGPVGGGLPLGAVVARSGALPAGLDTSPHAGHPWACAAGFVVAETINPAMFTHADDCGRELASALGALCGQFPDRLAGHHGVGLLRGLRLRDPARAAPLVSAARSRGLHLAPPVGGTVTISPVLVSSLNEMRRGVDLLADAVLCCEDTPPPGESRPEGQ